VPLWCVTRYTDMLKVVPTIKKIGYSERVAVDV
jgi:hypothetical protein